LKYSALVHYVTLRKVGEFLAALGVAGSLSRAW